MKKNKNFSESELSEIFDKYDPKFNVTRKTQATAFSDLSIQNYALYLIENNK